MNRIYRLVWNRTLNAFVVGSELASAHGKRSGATRLSPPWSVGALGVGGALLLALGSPAYASDAKLDDLQALVAKYSQESQSVLATLPAPGVQAAVNANAGAAVKVPAVAEVRLAAGAAVQAAVSPRPLQATVNAAAHLRVGASLPVASTVIHTAAQAVQPVTHGLLGSVTTPGAGNPTGVVSGVVAALLPGKEQGGKPLPIALGATADAVKELVGGIHHADGVGGLLTGVAGGVTPVVNGLGQTLGGTVQGATGSAAVGTTVSGTVATVGATLNGVTTTLGTLGAGGQGGNPVGGGLASTVGAVKELVGGLHHADGVGGVLTGVTGGVAPLVNGLGQTLGGTVQGATGSAALGTTVSGTVATVGGTLNGVTTALGTLGAGGQGGHPVGGVLAPTVGAVKELVGGLHHADGVGGVLVGVTGGVAPLVNGVGQTLGGTVQGVTGSAQLGAGVTGTVAAVGNTVGGVTTALGGLGSAGHGGNPVGGTLNATVGAVKELVAGLHHADGVGGLLGGVTGGVAPVLNGVGQTLGGTVQGVTGSAQLGAGVTGTVAAVGGAVNGVTTALGTIGTPSQGGSPLTGVLGAAAGAVKGVAGGVVPVVNGAGQALGGIAQGATGSAALGTTVSGTVAAVGNGVTGVTNALGALGAPAQNGNPVANAVTGTVGAVGNLAGDLVKTTGVAAGVDGVVDGAAPVLNGVGQVLGGTVAGVTGSGTLGNGVTNTVGALTGGLQNTTGALATGNVTGTVQNLLGTVGNTATTLLGSVGSTLGGLTGSTSGLTGLTNTVGGLVGGLTGGLSNVVGQLTGAPAAPAAPSSPPVTNYPSSLIVGNGGAVGTVGSILAPTLESVLSTGNGYVQNGSLTVSSANFRQGYSTASVLGLPLLNLSPVGQLIDGTGAAVTGSNSHLTLLGGVTSDSYIYNINNGDPNGLLGLLLPKNAPAWASKCLDVLGAVQVNCWTVNAAQDYQVLIGDGAFANGSKEVVIGTNAQHRLAQQDANVAFPGAGANDPNSPTGVPSADYDARLGHSVVIGDNASGTANAQTLLGAGATSDKANSVALGFKSDASRGGLGSYTAFGLSAAQNSIGEVAVGSVGRERQITHVAAGTQGTDAVNLAQLQGALSLIVDVGQSAVLYDEDAGGATDYSKVTLGGGHAPAGTRLLNLAAGSVTAGSTDAINGGQLFGVSQSMAGLLGGGATVGLNGVINAPTYQINSIGVGGVASLQGYTNLGTAFGSISDSLLNLRNLLPTSNPGGSTDPLAVHYTADASGNATNEVLLKGSGSGAVAVRNVAAGSVTASSSDAINGSQLAATNNALSSAIGGVMKYDSVSGQWTGPSFTVTAISSGGGTSQQAFGNVTDAFAAMDSSIVNVNKRIDNIQNGGAGNAYFSVNSTKAAASATGQDSLAAGPAATASGTGSVAIGNGANASAAGSVALGAGSVADRANTVSVGAAGSERQITNVADGTASTDAVNVRQLQASQQGTVRYDQNTDGSTNYASVTMGKSGTSTVIHNVGTGVAPTDAVNVAQLNKGMGDVMDWSRSYTDQRFNDVGRDIKRIDNRASAGIASAMAMAGLPQPTEAGRRMASFAASTFHGESSMAVGVSGVTDGGRWIYKLSGSANTRGDGGVTVGAGFQW